MIGGTDIELKVKQRIPATEVILRTIRRHWPHCVIQNVDDEAQYRSPDANGRLTQPVGKDFFVYRDKKAALRWDQYGATPSNRNTMLYVIRRPAGKDRSKSGSVTLVCSDLSGDIKEIVEEIKASLEGSRAKLARGASRRRNQTAKTFRGIVRPGKKKEGP